VVLPIFSLVKGRKELPIHLYNIRTGWSWARKDLKWLALMLPAAFSKKFVLPEQDKFNAAEKINFISGMLGLPVFIITGIMIWLHIGAWMAWIVHVFVALMMTPTMLGHIFMATINPDTKVGLSGMITGYVDRHWAKHHYTTWYKEHFEKEVAAEQVEPRRDN
jgi:formate dehydrogenase gamma subunit